MPAPLFATGGLAGVIVSLISGPVVGFMTSWVLAAGIGGAALLAIFIWYESRASAPLLPLTMFRAPTFTGANLTTLFVYAALSGLFFLLMLQLQTVLGLSPLWAGAALLPSTSCCSSSHRLPVALPGRSVRVCR